MITNKRASDLEKWNKGKYFWHIFNDREAAIVRKHFNQYLRSQDLTAPERAVMNALIHRTLDQNKAAEFVPVGYLVEETGYGKRSVMYGVEGLKGKGLISRLVLNKHTKTGAYIVNFDKIDVVMGKDVFATVANYMKAERKRLSSFSVIDDYWCNRCTNPTIIGAIGAPLHRIINNSKDNLQNNHLLARSSTSEKSGLRLVYDSDKTEEENMASIKDVLPAAIEKSDAAAARKRKKDETAAGKLSADAVDRVWCSAVKEHFPDIDCGSGLSVKDRSMLRAHTTKVMRTKAAALHFIEWSIAEWRRVVEANRHWLKEVPEYPTPRAFVALSHKFLEYYGSAQALKKDMEYANLPADERLEHTLRDRGYHDDEVAEIVAKKRKQIERHDEALKSLANSRRLYESSKAIRNEAARDVQRARLEARKFIEKAAAEMGIDPQVLFKKKRDTEVVSEFTTGPDGKQYPADVNKFMVFPEWHDDPKVLKQRMDEAFFVAVREYNLSVGIADDEQGQGNRTSA